MALFQLDPQSIAQRVRAGGQEVRLPTLGQSILRGMLGFTLLSIAGFAPWPIFERWFRSMREMQLYITCTLVFIGLSGPLLHRLILGPGSLGRFYKLFTIAFLGYAGTWVGLWVWLRGDVGEFAALAGGVAVMAAIFVGAFDAWRSGLLVLAALFIFNAAGYYAGAWCEGRFAFHHRLFAITLWALCYGWVLRRSGRGLPVRASAKHAGCFTRKRKAPANLEETISGRRHLSKYGDDEGSPLIVLEIRISYTAACHHCSAYLSTPPTVLPP